MPHPVTGFTGNEIKLRVFNFLGVLNTTGTGTDDTALNQYVEDSIFQVELDFCMRHNWKFLYKKGLDLSIINGTHTYETTALLDGATQRQVYAKDIFKIYAPTTTRERMLEKISPGHMTRLDPASNDGNDEAYPKMWADIGRDNIKLWPAKFKDEGLKVDAKIAPVPFMTMVDYPTIPIEYQMTLIHGIIALALARENDARVRSAKEEYERMILFNMRHDMTAGEENVAFTLYGASIQAEEQDISAAIWKSMK